MKPLKEKISITIDTDLLKKLRKLAEEDDRSVSSFINIILRKVLERNVKCFSIRRIELTPPALSRGCFLYGQIRMINYSLAEQLFRCAKAPLCKGSCHRVSGD